MVSHEQSPPLNGKVSYAGLVRSKEATSHVEGGQRTRAVSAPWRVLLSTFVILALYGCFSAQQRTCQYPGKPESMPVENSLPTTKYTCTPDQSCWPQPSQWIAFNQSIDGNLKPTVPWAASCYSDPSSEACQDVAQGYGDGFSRTAQYGAMEFLDWETCGQSQCFLDPINPSSPVSGNCSLGRLSTYHVQARTADDISKTLDFVREHGIRVSIKNTGHDYFGRSNAANSLAIWTHKMKDAKYHKTFQPQGCKTRYEDVGEIGAGIQAQEAVEFFEPLGMMVTVGAVGSVGIAGGFGQGGGHGPLGPAYGLMVDQALEFEVVTSDGRKRTINECTDSDLFWAMRGGGGGSYAVLTSYKFQLHAAVPLHVYSFQARFPAAKGELNISESNAHRDVIRSLASNQLTFAQHGMAGYNFILADHMISLQVMPSNDGQLIKKVTAEWHDFLTSYPGLDITDNTYRVFSTFSEWSWFTETPAIARNGPVGLGIMEAGRFLPRNLFASPESIEQVVDAVVNAMQYSYRNMGACSAQLYATGPHNQPDNSKTGVNPAWRTSLWEVIMGGAWFPHQTSQDRAKVQRTVATSIQGFKDLTPGGGCYVNEGDWTEAQWQQTFFGDNYDALLAVKKRYDAENMFHCWKCVGWTGYDDPMYSCYSQSKKPPRPSIPLGPVG